MSSVTLARTLTLCSFMALLTPSSLALAQSPEAPLAEEADAEVEAQVVLGLRGGTFMPWDAVEETGNGYGVTLGVNLDDWRLLAGFGGILPRSSLHGHFSIVWLETQWHPLQDALRDFGFPLWPYVLAGVAVALVDDYGRGSPALPVLAPDAVRWVPSEVQVVGMGGLGVSLGDFDGFSVSVDLRFYNDVFGGIVASADYAF